jgi:hypothetical protein
MHEQLVGIQRKYGGAITATASASCRSAWDASATVSCVVCAPA